MTYQLPKDSSEAGDECGLLPASEMGVPRAKEKYRRLTAGYLALLLLLLFATNAATAVYFSKPKKVAPFHTYSITCRGLSNIKPQATDTNKLPSIPLKSIGQHSKP